MSKVRVLLGVCCVLRRRGTAVESKPHPIIIRSIMIERKTIEYLLNNCIQFISLVITCMNVKDLKSVYDL